MKKRETIKREMRRLRKMINADADPIETRIAYSIECALQWVTENEPGYTPPHKDVPIEANCMRGELDRGARR